MAQVNFNNATLEPNPNISNYYPLQMVQLRIGTGSTLVDSSNNSIANGLVVRQIELTTTKITHSFTGTFSASGTEIYIRDSNQAYWRISNVSFSENDTFSFIIEMSVSVA